MARIKERRESGEERRDLGLDKKSVVARKV